MYRSIAYSLALLMCCSVVRASEPLSGDPAQNQAVLSQRMAGLAPSLRQWVVEEGRRRVDSGPDVEIIGEDVRARLSGQNYKDTDVDILVQLVLMQVAKEADADLRAALEQMKAVNERKSAQRETARRAGQAQQEQRAALRDSLEQRTRLRPSATAQSKTLSAPLARQIAEPLQSEVDQIRSEKDSLSELSDQDQLKMQMYMDRMTKADSALSNAMKKFSETSSTIISNLK